MLDDLKYIHQKDADDALGVVGKQWQQLQHSYDGVDLSRYTDIQNVVLAGMGGSALPAVFLSSWPGTTVPLEIARGYEIPAYVNEHTLFISSSYSGNTEETLSALAAAEAAGAQIVVIAAGGKLAELAKEKEYPTFMVPGGIQPRMSSFYFLAAFVQLLEPLGLVAKGAQDELKETASWLGEQDVWQADTPVSKNPAKALALDLVGKSVVVYSGPKLYPAANKFKICLNENAKNVAWVNYYPEFNHNEFIGWSSHPVDKPYAVVEIRSNLEHPRVQRRFEVTEKLLSGMRPSPKVIAPKGETLLQQLLWTAVFCDYTSLYVALLNGLNPTPVDLVEKLKKELG